MSGDRTRVRVIAAGGEAVRPRGSEPSLSGMRPIAPAVRQAAAGGAAHRVRGCEPLAQGVRAIDAGGARRRARPLHSVDRAFLLSGQELRRRSTPPFPDCATPDSILAPPRISLVDPLIRSWRPPHRSGGPPDAVWLTPRSSFCTPGFRVCAFTLSSWWTPFPGGVALRIGQRGPCRGSRQ